ncbi:efflux RND transporter periplasmic adaptor subunit [Pseudoalteromonas sp. ZZD1]|uniref:efflux RND transporter periplasmic adaptor subunit n=1 Tax=Pseudoalteromonas sp. ZZD1 TaxID=3139395 RepID=UPI003BAC391D
MIKYLLSAFILLTPCISYSESLVHVAAYTVQQQAGYYQTRTLSGQVIKQHDAKLSFEFPGKIEQVYFDQGEYVKQGDIIAQQNTQLLAIDEQKLHAQKQRIQAQHALAELEKKRLAELDKKNYSAASALDQVKTNIAVLNAELAEIEASLNEINIRTQKAHLTAPFNGILGQRFASKGEIVAAATPIVRLIENQHAQVSIGIPLILKNTIKNSMDIEVAGQTFAAQSLSKGASIDPDTQTLTMRFSLPDHAVVYSGQLAKLTLQQYQQQTGFWVPLDALADGIRGTWQVYQIKDNILKPIIVQLYYAHDGYAFIGAPLQNGEQIVANGMHKLSANISVNIAENQPTKVL